MDMNVQHVLERILVTDEDFSWHMRIDLRFVSDGLHERLCQMADHFKAD